MGFGILNTKLMNVAMKLNWVCKLLSEEQGLWTDLICAKYFHTNELFLNSSRPGSQFGNSLTKLKSLISLGTTIWCMMGPPHI
jgi:hypothetical protein